MWRLRHGAHSPPWRMPMQRLAISPAIHRRLHLHPPRSATMPHAPRASPVATAQAQRRGPTHAHRRGQQYWQKRMSRRGYRRCARQAETAGGQPRQLSEPLSACRGPPHGLRPGHCAGLQQDTPLLVPILGAASPGCWHGELRAAGVQQASEDCSCPGMRHAMACPPPARGTRNGTRSPRSVRACMYAAAPGEHVAAAVLQQLGRASL